jgi:hypothetical protein
MLKEQLGIDVKKIATDPSMSQEYIIENKLLDHVFTGRDLANFRRSGP